MSWLVEHRLSPAMVVALIALFVAMGGSAYAVIRLPPNSVGTKQLKNGAVTNAKLRNGAVTATKVKMGSLLASNFKAGQLPQGPKGTTGPAGATGPQGPSGATNVVVRTQSLGATPAGEWVVYNVQCQTGERATGGGAAFATGPDPNDSLMWSEPVTASGVAKNGGTPTGWSSILKNNSASARASTGYVVCAQP